MKSYRYPILKNLKESIRADIESEMSPSEAISWVDQPNPNIAGLKSLPILLFAIPWTCFSVFWTVMAYGAVKSTSGWGLIFPLWGVPFVLIGIGMLLTPVSVYMVARSTVYIITSSRVLIIRNHRKRTIQSFSPRQITALSRRETKAGNGDVILTENVSRDSDGDLHRKEVALLGIKDVKRVEALIKTLIEKSR